MLDQVLTGEEVRNPNGTAARLAALGSHVKLDRYDLSRLNAAIHRRPREADHSSEPLHRVTALLPKSRRPHPCQDCKRQRPEGISMRRGNRHRRLWYQPSTAELVHPSPVTLSTLDA